MTAALRFPISLVLAVLVNVLLFVFVIRLVTGERERLHAARDDISVIEFVRLQREKEPPSRVQRQQLPEPPAPVNPPPTPKEPQRVKPPDEPPPIRMLTPELAPPLRITGAPELPAVAPPPKTEPARVDAPLAVQETPRPVTATSPPGPGPVSDEPQFDQNLQAIYKPDPRYPPRALRAGIEGVVTVEFTVTPEGGVKDVKVVKAEPPGVFDDAAVQGVTKWKFQPKVIDGTPIARKARLDINFKLRKG
ncbi:MAG: TonB family protein [Chromatiales bacterium]